VILDPQLYALFLTAALLLTLAPGPDTSGVAVASGAAAGWLRSSPGVRRALDAVSGLVFVGPALRLVLARRKPASTTRYWPRKSRTARATAAGCSSCGACPVFATI
jgi:threonine/homoserine/homoserine lactone efflux protein